jgi:membrane protein implicated in regulation of membrane protease activity
MRAFLILDDSKSIIPYMEYFENLEPILKTFWFIAIPTSLIFLLQSILTFVGADGDTDLDSGSAFEFFSLRNLVNFLLGFSWTGISFYNSITNKNLLIALAFIVGVIFVNLFFSVIRRIQRLEEDNSFKMRNTLDKTAEVYLTIPAHKSGKGKITISVNGSVHELEAMTNDEKIETGSLVKVVNIENEKILIVQKVK